MEGAPGTRTTMTGESFPDRFKRWYGLLPPALRLLMTLNTGLYLAWVLVLLLGLGAMQQFVLGTLALTPAVPDALARPWQILTYGFVHIGAGFWGFIAYAFNMLWLYWIGRDYEEIYGSHRLFGLYVLATAGGGILVLLGAVVFGGAPIPVAGALAAVLGVLCGVATLNPERSIGLLLLGVVPIKWIAVGFLVLAVLFFAGSWPYVLAFLGAAGTGFGFARAQQAGYDLSAWARPLFGTGRKAYGAARGRAPRPSVSARFRRLMPGKSKGDTVTAETATLPRRSASPGPRPADDDVIDRLLDKISAEGYDALTEEEKRALYQASRND